MTLGKRRIGFFRITIFVLPIEVAGPCLVLHVRGAVDLDYQQTAVRKIEFSVEIANLPGRIAARTLSPWRRESCLLRQGTEFYLGQRVTSAGDVAQYRPHDRDVTDPPGLAQFGFEGLSRDEPLLHGRTQNRAGAPGVARPCRCVDHRT